MADRSLDPRSLGRARCHMQMACVALALCPLVGGRSREGKGRGGQVSPAECRGAVCC